MVINDYHKPKRVVRRWFDKTFHSPLQQCPGTRVDNANVATPAAEAWGARLAACIKFQTSILDAHCFVVFQRIICKCFQSCCHLGVEFWHVLSKTCSRRKNQHQTHARTAIRCFDGGSFKTKNVFFVFASTSNPISNIQVSTKYMCGGRVRIRDELDVVWGLLATNVSETNISEIWKIVKRQLPRMFSKKHKQVDCSAHPIWHPGWHPS